MSSLWQNASAAAWHRALDSYGLVVARQGVARLPDLDLWYRDELPAAIAKRRPRYATHAELVELGLMHVPELRPPKPRAPTTAPGIL